MKIVKAIKEINWRAERIQTQLNNRKDLELTELRVMELLGKKEGLKLAIEILNENR